MRVYVVEDHFEMRSVLVDFLSADPGFTVLGAAATAEEALQWLENEDTGRGPELLLVVDLSLPGMNGIQLVSRVGERWPGVDCVMLSGHGQKAQAREALDAGARGYVVKGNPGELADALRQVRSGKIFLTESLR